MCFHHLLCIEVKQMNLKHPHIFSTLALPYLSIPNIKALLFQFLSVLFHRICLFGILRRFQHCTGHITTGSWKGRGNQYI